MVYFRVFFSIFAIDNKDMSNPLKSKFMKKEFELTERLRMFLSVGSNYRVMTLGNRLPVSIRRRYRFSQSIVIYPESDYDFFLMNEMMSVISLAKSLELDASVAIENGVPVIEVSDYGING